MVPFILYELSNGFLNFLHRAFKESHANFRPASHFLTNVCRDVSKVRKVISLGGGNQISTDTPIKAMLFESIESSNSSIPPYQSQLLLHYTTNFTFCQALFLFFYLPIFISTNHLAHGNGLEVEILFNEIDVDIQSHATFCPYRFNTAYTLPCTSDSLPNQFWPYQPGRIEPLRGIDNSPLYVYLRRLHFGQTYSAINYGNYSIDLTVSRWSA